MEQIYIQQYAGASPVLPAPGVVAAPPLAAGPIPAFIPETGPVPAGAGDTACCLRRKQPIQRPPIMAARTQTTPIAMSAQKNGRPASVVGSRYEMPKSLRPAG